ncbi:MAG TPA: hypothetical protein VFA18_02445 [Gemmataceae bacterium]|nr:hypothetical protein [Gemmataceae bacterium]
MGFVLGFLLGLLTAIGLFAGLAYWLCTRPNHSAVAKVIHEFAVALAHRPKPSEETMPGNDGEEMERQS